MDQSTDILKRKLLAMHFAKSEERLAWEEKNDPYLLILCEGESVPVEIDGETYYKINKKIDSISKISVLDPKYSSVYSAMKLRARFNGQRRCEVYGCWIPKEWNEHIASGADIEPELMKYIESNKFEI